MTESGELVQVTKEAEGYKPIEFEKIPKEFDESTQYIMQKEPEDKGDIILIGIEIHDLQEDESDGEG